MSNTCTNCGCSKPKCGCQDTMLTTPIACPTPVGCLIPEPCSEIVDAQCTIYMGEDILCGDEVVAYENTSVAVILNSIIQYFCNSIINVPITVVEAGNNITVIPTVVGNTTTYTVSTASTPEIVLFKAVINREISTPVGLTFIILRTEYEDCIPFIGQCGASTGTLSDLIIQGYALRTLTGQWEEFLHNDKSVVNINLTGDITITASGIGDVYPILVRIVIIG